MGAICSDARNLDAMMKEDEEDQEEEAQLKEDVETEEERLARIAREKRAAKRKPAVKELLETEKTYVDGLLLCIHSYFNGFSSDTKLIPAEDLKMIFNDLQTIWKFNDTFLRDLQTAYMGFDNDKTRIGDLFVKFCPYFKMYQNYCNNYDQAMVLLAKYSAKKAFAAAYDEIMERCQGKTLQSLLILPIQRLPRYKLCLTEIIKYTEPYHPDLPDLKEALKLVSETTTLINERMKEFEARQQVRAIEARFGRSVKLIKPHRTYIREGLMTKVDKTGKDKQYTFFLFSDMICYAAGDGTHLRMHQELPVDEAFFIEDVPHHDKYNDCAFELHTSVKSFVLHCNERNEKMEWMRDLDKVISDLGARPNKTQQRELAAPLMIPDDWSEVCQMADCDTKFSFVNRRHHCRFCGKLICSKCGKYKLTSKIDPERIVKPVCTQCFEEFKDTHSPRKAPATSPRRSLLPRSKRVNSIEQKDVESS